MNMFARFDENPAMTLQDIKETKRYGRTHARTDGRTWKQYTPPQTKFAGGIKTVYPTTNKVCGGYKNDQTGTQANVVGSQKNRLNKTVLLSTQIIC